MKTAAVGVGTPIQTGQLTHKELKALKKEEEVAGPQDSATLGSTLSTEPDLGKIKQHHHDGDPMPTPDPGPVDPGSVTSYPARIIILRHGEKPSNPDDPNLAQPAGVDRANELAKILPHKYPNVNYVFAAADSKASCRPVETITPTANALGLPVDQQFADKDYAQLAHTLLTDPQYAGKTILIDWHHGEIPGLVNALGGTIPDQNGQPETKWPGNSFDRIIQLDYGPNGQVSTSNLPQEALPGDSTWSSSN